MKKILIATGIFPPDIGGPATYALKLAEEFSGRGIRVAIVTYGKNFEKNPEYRISGVSRKWSAGLRQFLYFGKILILAKNSEAILILDSLGAGLPSVLAGKILRKKTIIRLGGDFLWEKYVESGKGMVTMAEFYRKMLYKAYPVLNYLIMFVLKQADVLAFTTNFQKDLYVQYCGIDVRKAAVIGNVFEKKSGTGSLYQENPKLILWAGRIIKLKNIDFLLRVFKRLLEWDNDLVLELIGDGPEKADITNLVAHLELSGRVRIINGLNRNLLLEKMNKSYFGILPSLSEISPNFALEYLSLNKPVIITQETGIKDQFPGLLYADPKQEESFIAAAFRLLDKKEYDNYQKLISEIKYHKTWKNLADEYLRLISL